MTTFADNYFNATEYLTNNTDVVSGIALGNFTSALDHFTKFGRYENRSPNAYWNPTQYMIDNTDVASAVGSRGIASAWDHFTTFGINENRASGMFTGTFNAADYLAANADVQTAVTAGSFSSAYEHFMLFGAGEGRAATNTAGTSITMQTGTTFMLTTGVDEFTASSETASTARNDAVTGGIGTMNASDLLDGGDGIDTITVRWEDGDQFGEISNFETINVIAREDNGAGTVADLVDVSGLETLSITGTTNWDVDNFGIATTLKLHDSDDTYTVAFDDLSEDADELSLTVDGFEGDLTIGTTGLESVAITASGDASDFTLTDQGTATIASITISGSTELELTLDVATDAVETIDASEATGDNTYDVSAVELDIAVTGGSGDETLTFAGTLNTADVIDGGAGDDTLTAEVDAATTVRPTVSNVESLDLDFSAAGTFDARNVTGATSLELSGITAAATVTRLASTVTALSITEDTATAVAISVTYATGADTAVTLTIGATNDDGDAVADLGSITIAGNDGALTISSEGDDDNIVNAVVANDAASLVIEATTNALTTTSISAAAAASVTINATAADVETTTIAAAAATSITLNATGGDVTTTTISAAAATSIRLNATGGDVTTTTISAANATSFTLNATGGDVTVTDATLTDATTIALNATGGAIATGDLTTAADAAAITVIADGDDANDVTIDLIDADFATSFDFTATDGADITVTDIVTLGEDSDADDVDNEINLTATGLDADDNGSAVSVTIADLDGTANATNAIVDLVTLVSDADGTVSFTVTASTDTDAEVTEVDATASAGTTTIDLSGLAAATEVTTGAGGSTTTLTSAADTFVGGAGDDTVTGGAAADDITLGEGSDTVIFTTAVTADTVQDFNDDDDLIEVDVANIGSDLVNGNGDSLVADTSVTLQRQASTASTDIAVGTQILVFTDDLNSATDMLNALDALSFATASTPTDGDDILVLWTDGSDTFLSSVNVNITTDAIDDGGVTNSTIVTLVGVTIGDLAAANFAFI